MTNIFFYGSNRPLPERLSLRAGPLSLIYEDGDLRYIRLGEREVIRRIYVAVRDRNWGTVPPLFSNIRMDIGSDAFRISYEVVNQQADIDFAWQGTIIGTPQGQITFAMEGQARSTFMKNRIGFSILHPILECTGAPCIVTRADGSTERNHFPTAIVPRQPFLDMTGFSHEIIPDVWADLRFEGDVFEMEDQRAWIDASFKTYCTPLRLPYPAEIQQGTQVNQTITLTLRGTVPAWPVSNIAAVEPVQISLNDMPSVALPRIGVGSASNGQPISDQQAARLSALNLSHLRVDLHLGRPDFTDALRRAVHDSQQLGVPLEIALFISDNVESELKALARVLPELKPDVCSWLVFPVALKSTTEDRIRLARQYLAPYQPSAQFGGGTNVYFTELNRDQPTHETMAMLDFLNYSANPQVHAFDNGSLSETCQALAATIDSTLRFAAGKPLSISPITLKPRFNAVATGPEPETPPGVLPWPVDARQMSLFGAGWTLGTLKYIAESGAVEHVTYYETIGWRGVMETESGSPLPDKFPSIAGAVFPLFHALADIGEFAGRQVRPTASSDSLRVEGFLLQKEQSARLLLTNWTPQEQRVRLTFGKNLTVRLLDETNVEQAMREPEAFRTVRGTACSADLTLRPFAMARIDMDL